MAMELLPSVIMYMRRTSNGSQQRLSPKRTLCLSIHVELSFGISSQAPNSYCMQAWHLGIQGKVIHDSLTVAIRWKD